MKIKPLPGIVLAHNMKKGERTLDSGIIIRNDDGKEHGIRNRWAQVYAVGEGVREIKEGDWILIEHGRWSRGITMSEDLVLWRIEETAILLQSDEEPSDLFVGTSTESGFEKEIPIG